MKPLEEIKEARLKKLHKMKEFFGTVFPADSRRSFSLFEVVGSFIKLARGKKQLVLAGRITGMRSHGGVIFCDFKDGSWDEKCKKTVSLQSYVKKDILGDESFRLFEETVDVGDFLEFKGTLFKTKKKEKSLKVSSWRVLAKNIRPLPEKWHGLSDVEERFRRRYLDLVMSDEVHSIFRMRSRILCEFRDFLNKREFVEVETPILQPLAGGALAEPFVTHHNALDSDLFLRIAPELYLKRLLVGGFEKVYEIGKNFRNEGIDPAHNPEFSELEFYQAYQDAKGLRGIVEDLYKTLVKKIFGKQAVKYEENQIIFSNKFGVISFYDVLKRHALISAPATFSKEDFKLKAQQFGIEINEADSKEKIADNIFKKVCRPKIIQPTFVIDYPIVLSPLAKRKENSPELADRFQLLAGGLELANGFSELNNPLEQREQFEKQQELRKAGDKEAAEYDWSYVEAMEYGMPPAAGVGIGIDRLVMLFSNSRNIKEVILFPTMRPKE